MGLEEYKGVYIYAQQVDNEISSIAFELIGKAKELAADLGTDVTAVLLGHNVGNLVDSLADLGSRTARQQVIKRIEQLNQNSLELNSRICELESFTSQYTLTDIEFNLTAQTLSVFSTSIDEMSLEQKRTLIRTLIQKVIWDGSSAHVIFWGTSGIEKDKNILFK